MRTTTLYTYIDAFIANYVAMFQNMSLFSVFVGDNIISYRQTVRRIVDQSMPIASSGTNLQLAAETWEFAQVPWYPWDINVP